MGKNRYNLKYRKIFAENLKRIRKEKGLSQDKLAVEAGLHRTYVGSVERGERNISIDNMERFAIVFGVRIEELLKTEDK
jgi:transcriptional regulator with XRE-family HTH domain